MLGDALENLEYTDPATNNPQWLSRLWQGIDGLPSSYLQPQPQSPLGLQDGDTIVYPKSKYTESYSKSNPEEKLCLCSEMLWK